MAEEHVDIRGNIEGASGGVTAVVIHGDVHHQGVARKDAATESEHYLKWCKERANKHIRTSLYHQVLTKLREKKSVLLLADAGDGKSTLLQLVALQYGKGGFLTIEIDIPADVDSYKIDDKNVLFVCDNLLGETNINEHKTEAWKNSENKHFPDQAKFLFACRLEFWRKRKADLETKQIFNETIVVTSDQLTDNDKELMLHRHVGDQIPRHAKERIVQISKFAFPECCRFASHSSTIDFSDTHNLEEIFSNHFRSVIKQLKLVKKNSKVQYAALVFCLINGRKFPKTGTHDVCKQANFDEVRNLYLSDFTCTVEQLYDTLLDSVEELDDWLLTKRGDNYTFYHDTIFEAMCRFHGDRYPDHILTYCGPKTVTTVFTTKQVSGSEFDRVTLPPRLYKQLVKLVTAECLNEDVRYYSEIWRFVFRHMNNKDILKEWSISLEERMSFGILRFFFRKSAEPTEPTMTDVLMLMTKLPDCCLRNTDDVFQCAVHHGDFETVVSLIDSDVTSDGRWKALKSAQQAGHSPIVNDILKALEQGNIKWSLYDAVTSDNVEMITKVLKLRPDTDTDTIHKILWCAVWCGSARSVGELLKRQDLSKETIQTMLHTDDRKLFESHVTQTVRDEIRAVLVKHLTTDS